MAILSQEQYMNTIKTLIGENTSDDALKTLEDLTDTYNDLNGRVGEDWKAKHDALDAAWRQRYRDRFFHGEPSPTPTPIPPADPAAGGQVQVGVATPDMKPEFVPMSNEPSDPQAPENIGIDDLFTPAE